MSLGVSFLPLLLRGLRCSLGSCSGLFDLLTGLGDLDLLAPLGEILRRFLASSGSLGSYPGLFNLLVRLGDLDLLALLGEILRRFLGGSDDSLPDDDVE